MAVTVRSIVELPSLGLTVVAGEENLDHAVRWVHVSEVIDPTPWLKGGEFLLTTGMQMQGEAFDGYVARLARVGVAGLGFGVGVTHDSVPRELREAAQSRGLPLLEVPVETPYVAISEAVSDMLVAERGAAATRALVGQQELIRAALAGGSREILEVTGRLLGRWAIHADADGGLIAAAPPEAGARMSALTKDLSRMRLSGASSAVLSDDDPATIQVLSTDGRVRGFLITGSAEHDEYERMIVSGAVVLLTLETERSRSISVRMQRVRSHALSQMLLTPEPPERVATQLATWRMGGSLLRVLVAIGVQTAARQVYNAVLEHLADRDTAGAATLIRHGDHSTVAILVDTADADALLEGIGAHSYTGRVYYGIGPEVGQDSLPHSYAAALRAARVGRIENRTITRAADMRALDLLLRSGQPEAIAAFVRDVLGVLAADRAVGRDQTLRQTLVAYLDNNGHWNDTAAALGVHRHTLRSRVEAIEELTGRDLRSPYARMEMWLALLAEGGEQGVPVTPQRPIPPPHEPRSTSGPPAR